MAFSDSMKAARERKNMTQECLAKITGASQAAISLFESGRKIPNVVLGVSIAKALGMTVEEMVER